MEFPEDFFKRETRCGFEIPEMMKRAWAAELEVLQAVTDVCKNHGLQYFADWGTLLGAVRHQGFIPWDDDIDICLKREDYLKLVRLLPGELPEGFTVAGMYAEAERLKNIVGRPHIRVLADEEYWNINDYMKKFHGFPYPRIGIDIFPLDYVPRDEELVAIQKEIISYGIYTFVNWDIYAENGELESRLSYIEQVCNVVIPRDSQIKNFLLKLLDSLAALYGEDEADEMFEFCWSAEYPEIQVRKEWYQETVYLPFENIKIAVPSAWHEVLTAQYGDYTVYLKGTAGHDYPFYGHFEDELVNQIRAVGFAGTVEEFCRKVSSGELRV